MPGQLQLTPIIFSGVTSGTTTLSPQAVASGSLTLPAATDTLVGRATSDTLTNKVIDGSQIVAASLTYAKIQNVSATARLLGRSTGGAGVIEELTVGTGLLLSGGVLSASGGSGASAKVAIVSGAFDGTNKVYTLQSTITGQEFVFLNGQLQTPGSGFDYTLSGTTLTFINIAPISPDQVQVFGYAGIANGVYNYFNNIGPVSNATGLNGDQCIDTNNGDIYYRRAGVWTLYGANAWRIQGINVTLTLPNTGQVLQYDGTQYVPVTLSGGGGAPTGPNSYTNPPFF